MPEWLSSLGGSGWRSWSATPHRAPSAATARTVTLHIDRRTCSIPPLYRNASLDNFKLPTDNPTANRGLSNVLLGVKSFAREFPSEKKPGLLLIVGPAPARRTWPVPRCAS